MARLANDANAFVRPSPSSGTLGGVAAKTRECMLVLEAALYDTVLVETMGTGQSETVVADMTDFFLLLMLPGAGDELQGLKKGVVELADMIAVNKADGDNVIRAEAAAAEYQAALHILSPQSANWSPPVMAYSALTGDGVENLATHPRTSRAHERLRGACPAPEPTAGQMDVVNVGGADRHTYAVPSRAQGEFAEARGGGCRRAHIRRDGGRRDRCCAEESEYQVSLQLSINRHTVSRARK